MTTKKSILLIVIVLLIDQVSKIYIKTHFKLGDELYVFDWFRIRFIENNGAAWGTELGGNLGKLILSIFRIGAIIGIGVWLTQNLKQKSHNLMIIAISLIFCGALGNIIDSVIYGVLFTESTFTEIAAFQPGNGYKPFLMGKVVDMLYFPIWQGIPPQWIPIIGGKHFTFFNAIFNIADTAISIGVLILIVFNQTLFPSKK